MRLFMMEIVSLPKAPSAEERRSGPPNWGKCTTDGIAVLLHAGVPSFTDRGCSSDRGPEACRTINWTCNVFLVTLSLTKEVNRVP